VDAELNAICDFILEAGEWAAELAAVPLEQRQISRSFFRFFLFFLILETEADFKILFPLFSLFF
jgi:hypothetical protein